MSDEQPTDWRDLIVTILGALFLFYLPAAAAGALVGVILTDSAGIWNVIPAAIAVGLVHHWAAPKK